MPTPLAVLIRGELDGVLAQGGLEVFFGFGAGGGVVLDEDGDAGAFGDLGVEVGDLGEFDLAAVDDVGGAADDDLHGALGRRGLGGRLG